MPLIKQRGERVKGVLEFCKYKEQNQGACVKAWGHYIYSASFTNRGGSIRLKHPQVERTPLPGITNTTQPLTPLSKSDPSSL